MKILFFAMDTIYFVEVNKINKASYTNLKKL